MNIRNNKGVALVITLLVLTLLIVLILEFSQGMRVEARAAANFRDDIKAYYLARSGITFAIAVLEDDYKTNPNYDALDESWAQKLPPIPLGDGFVSVEITDESGKINVNKISAGSNMRTFMINLLKQFELEEYAANAIVDWRDYNDGERETQPEGAESHYYESLEDPYEAKNKDFDSLQELRLVKWLDNEVYNKVQKFLTVHSEDKININTAGKEVIKSLSDNITGEDADEIIAFRGESPFQDLTTLKNYIFSYIVDPTEQQKISSAVTFSSNYFSIISRGEVNQSQKIVRAVVKRQAGSTGQTTSILYWRVE